MTWNSYQQLLTLYNDAIQKLRVYIDRPDHAKLLYWVRLIGLLLGDIAGVAGASLLLGELVPNAFGQAISAAVAAITLGAIGSETKKQVQQRTRAADWENLGESFEPFRRFFIGRTDADRVVRIVTWGALAGIALIAVAIFSLRDATEGGAAGLCFGLIAAAVGIGSYVNSFVTTCGISEYLDELGRDVSRAKATLEESKKDPVLLEHDGSLATAKNIRDTWAARGRAAQKAREREKWAILSNNPRVVGHGEPAGGANRKIVLPGDEVDSFKVSKNGNGPA